MECLCHKGILELRTGNPDEALLRYSEALSIARSLGLARAAARELLFLRGELLAEGTDEALLGLPGWER
jgi:hypothetical protein